MNDSVERAVATFLGADEIEWEKLKPVMCFVVLWNRLEARNNCHIDLRKLQDLSKHVADSAGFDLLKYKPQITFFQERYTEHPRTLKGLFRSGQRSESVVERTIGGLISGKELTPHQCLEAVLMIPYRIRNNLFHGNKSTHELYDQTSLFDNVNEVLCLFHSDLR